MAPDAFDRLKQFAFEAFSGLEGIAERIATDVLTGQSRVEALTVTVRKPGVPIDGVLDWAGVTLERARR